MSETQRPMTGLQWVAWNMERVRKICEWGCRGRRDLVDDLFSECVDRADRCMLNYDYDKGTLHAHMKASLKWYVWKFMNRHARVKTCGKLGTGSLPYDPAVDRRAYRPRLLEESADREELEEVMCQLPEQQQHILKMKHAEELTYQQIGDVLGVSKGTARVRHLQALSAAQRVAEREQELEELWREAQRAHHAA